MECRSIKGMMGHCLVVLQHNLSSTGGKGIVGQRQPRKCMTRQLQCAEQQDSHSNFTKYCACHACAFLSLHLGQLMTLSIQNHGSLENAFAIFRTSLPTNFPTNPCLLEKTVTLASSECVGVILEMSHGNSKRAIAGSKAQR